MKILLTGATGFIGKSLCLRLLKNNVTFNCIVRKNTDVAFFNAHNISYYVYDGDICKLIVHFNEEKYKGIVHLASLFIAEHDKEQIDDLIGSNIVFGTKLLEACIASNVKWFLNTGTFWQHYQNEEYNPVNLYAATKESFEKIAKFYTEISDLIFLTLKLSDTFGPNDIRKKIFNLWNRIESENTSLAMSPGQQVIDISYIEDVINAYFLLIKDLNSRKAKDFKNKVFAIKSTERMTLKELSQVYEKATNTKLNINWGVKDYRNREVMIPWMNGEKVPGWSQEFSLEDAIKKTIK
jgi:CDP-paratose synthetase